MRNFFLLLTCVMLFLLLKELPAKKNKLERVDIVKSHVIDFSGTLFIPKTLQADPQEVKSSFIKITVAGKIYHYVTCYEKFCLAGVVEEVPVSAGDKIEVTFPTKLFFAKEVE